MLKLIDLYMANNTMIKNRVSRGRHGNCRGPGSCRDYGDYEVDWPDNNIAGIHKEEE